MKEIFLIISILLTSYLPLSIGDINPSPYFGGDIPECGGKTDYTNPNAPKHIVSEDIVKFYGEFSTLAMGGESVLDGNFFKFEAALDENNRVNGVYHARYCDLQDDFNEAFETDASFMKELQSIIRKYDLARYNGIHVIRNGLPDNFGAVMDIKYASDEYIYANDNQDSFVSYDAITEIEGLFRKQIKSNPFTE